MSYYKILNLEHYFKMYKKSIREPRKFWDRIADENFTWYQKWDKVFEFDFETFPWHLIPKDMPVVCDMSSNIGTKNVPYDKLAMIYMGA